MREAKRRKLALLARAWILTHPRSAHDIQAEGAWIVGNAAGRFYGDNSAAIHQHLRRHHKALPVYWAIDEESPDLEMARAVGPVLFLDDVLSYVRAFLARVHIISHGLHDVPGCAYTTSRRIVKVRLGHGLTALKKTRPRRGHTNRSANGGFDLVPVCSEFEREHKLEWGISPERLVVTGLPRFDTLLAKQRAYPTEKCRLLYMPTWREEVAGDTCWEGTRFGKGVLGFLCNPKLHALLDRRSATLDVFLHINLAPHVGGLAKRVEGTGVRVVALTDPQRAFAEASLLVTDYSSVAWDMLYLNKPVVFYHFDLLDHRRNRGGHVDFDDSLPGPSLTTAESLIDYLEQHLSGTLPTWQEQVQRMRHWQEIAFAFRDEDNSARVVSSILSLLAAQEARENVV